MICPKCLSSLGVTSDGDEIHCQMCGYYGIVQPYQEVKIEIREKQYTHNPRPCQICGRTVLKPTKYGDLCVTCMRWLHAWRKNASHNKPPPYLQLNGQMVRNPFRKLHFEIATITNYQQALDLLEKIKKEFHHGIV